MPAPRPTRALLAPKAITDPNNRLTTCSRCGLGIFRGQAYGWSRQPTGLVHTPPCPGDRP